MDIYFTKIKEEIIKELRNSKFIVFISVAWIGEKYLIKELEECLKRGVKVELIINDDERFNHNRDKLYEFYNLGGRLFLYDTKTSLMHNKFCIIDLCTTITGSFNWTYGATFHQENIIVIKNNIEVAHKFAEEFLRLKHNTILYDNPQNSDNQDLVKRVKVSTFTIFNDEIEGFGAFIEVNEGQKFGVIQVKTDFDIDLNFIPEYVLGFWRDEFMEVDFETGKDVQQQGDKIYFDFVCVDPNIIKYVV